MTNVKLEFEQPLYIYIVMQNLIVMKLVNNIGNTDRTIRILISALIVFLFAAEFINGVLAITLLALGAILVVTALVGFCPLYGLFGVGSQRKRRL